jgi:hypothetical protein
LINMAVIRRGFRATLIAALAIVSGCGSKGPIAAVATDTGSDTVITATPAPPPPITPPALSTGLFGEVAIADNFQTASGIEPNPAGIAGQSTDTVGAFRMSCTAGQLLRDDPIVYPGQSGTSHLHQFWGNTGANANSNYQTLRTTGQTTCGDPSNPVNRTAYWMPAMLDGAGHAVKPDSIQIYYKQLPAESAACKSASIACVGLPNGIRFVFGHNMKTMSGGPADPNSMDQNAMGYECWSDDLGTQAVKGRFHTIAAVVSAGCPAGARLVIFFAVPGCWDGKNLDSADHRSHMTYGTPESGGQNCPSTHPYLISAWQGHIHFTTDANFVAGRWHLASDEMVPGTVPGSTLHLDYFEAWSPTVKDTWQKQCIDAHRSCSDGDLGNGTRIRSGTTTATHQLVTL